MQSTELLEQTASERLSLEQEYDMQQTWFQDENKCTFIILDKNKWLQPELTEIDCMAGDVNLFLDVNHDDIAEIEIMIAEPSCRRKGLGREALLAMMNYGVTYLGIKKYEAKIGCGNDASLTLFDKLGFVKVCFLFFSLFSYLNSNRILPFLFYSSCGKIWKKSLRHSKDFH
ncbi:N-acetyltransferase 9-like protein isoform X2 [Montipora capricornis]|uniref:N-acetyltransferase 9-like protein isoform X2 n=1 Tax=Montipora capricornis TaxID=246305 RepID=UPI0035F104BE